MAIMKVKRKSGKTTWEFKTYYIDWDGSKKQKKKEGFRTQREAKIAESEFLDKMKGSSNMLFSNLVEHYFEYNENRLKPTTNANKKVLINLKIQPYFGNMKLNEIQSSTVMKWQNELIAKGYVPTYLKSIHNQLSAIFNFAIKYYNHDNNPARICGSMGKKNADAMNFYTFEEFQKFIKVFDNDPTPRIMLKILFYSGIRLGELFALTPSSFDFTNCLMIIDENFQKVEGEEIILDPKSLSGRIALPKSLMIEIYDYLQKLPFLKEKDRIFTYSKSYLHSKMTKGARLAEIKRIRVHDLRHSHASHLIHLGFSPLIIKERLRHKDITTTLQTYSHLYPNTDTEVAEKLNELYT